MEAIGLGIGSVSLLFQVFAGCIKGYQLLSEARGLERSHQYFRVKFKTEQCRLLDWANVVDLSEDDSTLTIARGSRPLILQILDEQYRLMFRFGRLDDRLRPLTSPILHEDAETEESGRESNSASREDTEGTREANALRSRFPDKTLLLERSLRFFQNTTKYPERLRWAIYDKSNIEDILTKLTASNDYLGELLNTRQLQALGTQQARTNYHIMQLNDKIDDLCEIVKAGILSNSNASSGHRKRHDDIEYRESRPVGSLRPRAWAWAASTDASYGAQLASLAQVKGLMSAIDAGSLDDALRRELNLRQHAGSDLRARPTRLAATDLQLIEPGGHSHSASQRWSAWYKPTAGPWRRVWVEWKSSEPRQRHMGGGRSSASMVLRRFEALVQLLRENESTAQFRVLRCLGYYVQEVNAAETRPGLVFENPSSTATTTTPGPSVLPTTLLHLMRKHPLPSLSLRLQLIRILVDCVERLHAVNWLHKGLRSQNVLFFHAQDAEPDYTQPYLSGFDYSPPENAEFMSEAPPHDGAEDLYRHPAVQGGPRDDAHGFGFRKHHDIYSLGVVLLEIAYWRPVDVILGFDDGDIGRSSETAKVKEMLLGGNFDNHVRGLMGDTVADAIQCCLAGPNPSHVPLHGTASTSGTKLQEWFFDAVVRGLLDLRI
ncbi:hypothetical protein CTA2_3525 [Colletotrichum tanaceti]|uniref:Uncharacterized protein n=1 Tax=Colletotrichum tanaceti TaxID=1306861 RepID=A0A4U6XJD5_9PEZI|nr:hypothetical protein CTA2_3525 [Colletotrichum tanaceti]TKW55814.1 hypothetical protein CTA1_4243 [Colletotrichum tanaceti]